MGTQEQLDKLSSEELEALLKKTKSIPDFEEHFYWFVEDARINSGRDRIPVKRLFKVYLRWVVTIKLKELFKLDRYNYKRFYKFITEHYHTKRDVKTTTYCYINKLTLRTYSQYWKRHVKEKKERQKRKTANTLSRIRKESQSEE